MTEADVERCADDLTARWAAGDRPLAEEYFAQYPDLRRRADFALDLIAEELALRAEFDVPISAGDLAERFPEWQPQVKALLDCQRALGPRLGPHFPEPGERLGEFDLISELGRGGHGRVYLAAQPALAGRPVVLKVGPPGGEEDLSLARLQHSHIVPLFSAHDFPDRGLRGLCLPYYGGATFAAVQAHCAGRRASGKDVLRAIAKPNEPPPACGPAWGFLEAATLTEAACWVGACLADALEYAHSRGLVHFDIKPSNVLIAADGVPMLLDFHLARPPLSAGDAAPAWVGGTDGYMAPEHAAALAAVRDGRPVPRPVGARADIYSLGVLLRGFLHGTACDITPGLADILARCTAPAAGDRYPAAGDVAADLRRHLSDLPLKGVANRSAAERWAKWRRRRQGNLPVALAAAVLLAALGGAVWHARKQTDAARAALRAGAGHAAAGRYGAAAEVLRGGEQDLDAVPFQSVLRKDLQSARAAADRATAAEELHSFAETVRAAAASGAAAPGMAARCAAVWAERATLLERLTGQPTPALEARWRADLLDVGVLAADLGVRAAADRPRAVRQALATLAEAEGLLGTSAGVELETARYRRELGEPGREPAPGAGRGAWDAVLVGRSRLAAGDAEAALAAFAAATAADPALFWANALRGVCLLTLDRPAEAAAAFAAAIAAQPNAAWCYANRGLAFAALNVPAAALADFDRAAALDPQAPAAYLGRAGLHHAAGRHPAALADLDRAAAAGANPAEILYRKAVVRAAAGDTAAAAGLLTACLTANPGHAAAQELARRLKTGP